MLSRFERRKRIFRAGAAASPWSKIRLDRDPKYGEVFVEIVSLDGVLLLVGQKECLRAHAREEAFARAGGQRRSP